MAPRRGATRLAAVLLTALLPPLLADADIARTVRAASSRSRSDRSLVVAPGARPAVLAAMTLGEEGVQRVAGDDAEAAGSAAVGRKDTDSSSEDTSGTPLLVVTATGREAEETALALRSYLPADDVAVMPAWETLPHERLSPRADTVAQRLSVLRRLAHPEEGGAIRVLVVPVRALLAPVIAGLGELEPVQLAPGLTVGLEETARRLEAAAYTRVDMVESRGEYAVRGGILDVFPPSEPRPVRVDFFGDEIDEVSSFAVADQRTIETLGAVTATACRELVLTEAGDDGGQQGAHGDDEDADHPALLRVGQAAQDGQALGDGVGARREALVGQGLPGGHDGDILRRQVAAQGQGGLLGLAAGGGDDEQGRAGDLGGAGRRRVAAGDPLDALLPQGHGGQDGGAGARGDDEAAVGARAGGGGADGAGDVGVGEQRRQERSQEHGRESSDSPPQHH